MKRVFHGFYRFATSMKLAVWLIGTLLVIALIGSLVPQISIPSPEPQGGDASPLVALLRALQLNDIFSSYPFFITLVLLFLNISFCMARRVKSIFEDSGDAALLFSFSGLPRLGSLVFHLSMLIALVGAVYDSSTRMKGAMILAEGQEVVEKHDSFVSISEGPFFFENHSRIKLALRDVTVKYIKGAIVDFRADMTATDAAGSRDYELQINQPLQHGKVMAVIKQYGFAPRVRLWAPDGKKLVDGYVSLASSESGAAEDAITLPESGMTLLIRLYPDPEVKEGKIRSLTQELRDPQIRYQLDKKLKGGKIKHRVSAGFIVPGETADVQGYRLTVDDIRRWVQFDVEIEPGKQIIYAGYWLGLAGIVMRLLPVFLRPVDDDKDEAAASAGSDEKEKAV